MTVRKGIFHSLRAVLLAAVLLATQIPPVASADVIDISGMEIDGTIFESGSGKEADPFIIKTESQLRRFAGSLSGSADYSGMYIKISDEVEEIDISGKDWDPVGGSFYRFNGIFDGNGKTIRGMTEGSAEAPRILDGGSAHIGFFGWLNEDAVIRDLNLEDVAVYTNSPGSAYIGGITGRMSGSETEGDYRGARIDHCSVTGVISHTTDRGTTFTGGLVGHAFKGSIINSMTDVNVSCIEKSGELAEVGGIAGLMNRSLVANCYTLGDCFGRGYRDTARDIEGMACVGGIAGVNGGSIVNCYSEGDAEAGEYSIDTGLLAGWVTGIGKVYSSWYNEKARMIVDGRNVSPVDPFGEVVAGGVSDEYGFRYDGAMTDGIIPFEPGEEGTRFLVNGLNASFRKFPVDIQTIYGLEADSLRTWTVQGGRAVLGSGRAAVRYSQPEIERNLAKEPELTPMDGVWYGRSFDGNTVVSIYVKNGEIDETRVITGDSEGENFGYALARARFKAIYGDTSDYSPADPSRFEGSGTAEDPYRIVNEEQLRYLAESINEDVSWREKYFLQTEDIQIRGGDWKPIGWGVYADADNDGFGQDIIALYPFRGHYDGGGHTISNLAMGSGNEPAALHWAGLFGIIQGDYSGNEIPSGDANVTELKNVNLRNVKINVGTRWRCYAGGLTGSAQGGFAIRNCSVTGTIRAASAEDFASAGGLSGSLMYGSVTDCRTRADVTSFSGKNYSYAGGMSAVTNRSTIVNSYALGDVHADADQTNRAEAGGFVGLDGGVCVNCYAAGDVEIVSKYSMYLGGFAGMAASSSEHRLCYCSGDAEQTVAGAPAEEKKYAGKAVNESAESESRIQTGAFMQSEEFREILNRNRANLQTVMKEVREILGADERGSSRYHSVYYGGDGSDLREWLLQGTVVGFDESLVNDEQDQETPAGDDPGTPAGEEPDPVGDHTANCPSVDYTDLDPDPLGWYHSGVDYVIRNGWMVGTGENRFEPGGSITRAMVVTVLYRIGGGAAGGNEEISEQHGLRNSEESAGGTSDSAENKNLPAFTDLVPGSWYEDAVQWAAGRGIVKGVTDTLFLPDAPVTREELAVLLARFAAYSGCDTKPAGTQPDMFPDASMISAYAVESILWAAENGLINGFEDGTMQPGRGATRAQTAVLLRRFSEYILKNEA